MKNLVKYLKISGIFIGIIIALAFFMSLLNMLGLNSFVISTLNVIILLILFLIVGIKEGLNTQKKGFIAGLKIGSLLILILLLINLLFFRNCFNLSRIIYYLILLFSSIFGAMIGINKKEKN